MVFPGSGNHYSRTLKLVIAQENEKTSHRLGENICKRHVWSRTIVKTRKELLKLNSKTWLEIGQRPQGRYIHGKEAHRRNNLHIMSSGKYKWKWDTTAQLFEWLKFRTLTNTKCWWTRGATGSYIAGRNAKWYIHLEVWWFLTRLNIFLSHYPVFVLGIYWEELKLLCSHKTYTPV